MSTIRSTREIDAIFRTAKRVAHPLIIALVAQVTEERGPEGRVAFVAGKRLGNAVLRNRSRRVMRAATSRVGGPWPGWDVVLIAREGTAAARAADLDAALRGVLSRAGIAS